MADAPAPAPPDPQVAANRQQLMDRLTTARQQGATWDQIHQSLAGRVQAARQAGASDQQIQHSLGFSSPEELIAATQGEAQQHMAATKPTSWLEAFANGMTHSSSAALLGVSPTEAPVQGRGAQITQGLGEAVGDYPAAVVGGLLGGLVGGAGGAAATAETGPGVVAGTGLGAYAGGAAGATAVPQLIKSERDRYVKALAAGQVHGPEDFLRIQGQVMKDTGEAAAVGLVTAGAGRVAGPVLDKMGAGKVTKFLATAGTETVAMTTAQATLAGHMPRMEDFVDAAVTIGAFHTAHAIGTPAVRAVRTRLMQHYSETGETPTAAAARAVHDPIFRGQMMGKPEPDVLPGSSQTPVTPPHVLRPGTMANEHTPLPADVFFVPRVAGDADKAIAWTIKEEGGLTFDTGGETKYGISKNANPGVDVKNLSKEDAAEIYHKRYWRAIDADALPENMRLAAFDSAVSQGVGQTKMWLKEAGGDLQEFMRLRLEKYARLVRDPKYAPYARSWARRLQDLGASKAMAEIVYNGPNHIGKEFTPEHKAILGLSEGGEGGAPPPPKTTPSSEPEPEPVGGAASMKAVKDRTAPHEGVDWLGNSIEAMKRVYGELFDPMHPVRKLVDSVTKGDTLDDYRNPELLFRVAEGSGDVAKHTISKEMVDLDGRVTGPGLADIVSGKSVGASFSKAEQSDFLDGYAKAKWALMMDSQGKNTGYPLDHSEATVRDYGAKYEASFQHLVDWRNSTLRWLGDSGIHDQKKVDKLIEENGSTIPGYRRMDDGSWQPVSTGKPGIWNPITSAKGSKLLTEPTLKSLMQDAFLRHELASNNRAMVALADLGIDGNKAGQRRAVDFNVIKAMDDLKEQGIDEDMLSSLARAAGSSIPKDQVPIFREGKLYGVKFQDPELTRVLRGYDQSAHSTFMKLVASVTSVPRNLQTRFNPLFPIRLLTYDAFWQHVVNPDSKAPLLGFFSGLGHMSSDPEAYQEWARSGGADRVFDSLSKDQFMQRVLKGQEEQSLADNMWNAVKTPFEGLTAWTRMVSAPLRFDRYMKGKAAGETPLRAAVASTEASFHRPGYGGPVGKAWNSIVPYLTAHLNGMEKSARALMGLGRTVTGVEYSARSTLIKGAAAITIPALASWWFHKDEEWYKAMPDWQKDNALFIVPPIAGSPPIPIAAPPILSAIFVGIPRRMMEAFVQDNPHAGDNVFESLGASLLPPGGLTSASILTPIIEHIADYSFHRGRPLVSQDTINGVQPAEQFTQYSTPAAKALAQHASDLPLLGKLSPPVIDNYISQWGGPMGRAAIDASAAALGHPSNPPPERNVSEWPGISSWVARYPSASAAPIEQFYDTATSLAQEHGSLLKEMREGNFARFKEIVDAGGPTAAAYHTLRLGNNAPAGVNLDPYYNYLAQASAKADYQDMGLVQQASKALQRAREFSNNVYIDHTKTPHDKRQTLDMVNAQMQVISERGNEAMDRALIGVKSAGASARAPVPASIDFVPPQ